nr:putative ribonuclease H-like domain-containing protein [Tanacetum cinerariifolium]
MYENFNAPSTESLDSIFNRLQKIVSRLAILVHTAYEVSTANTQSSTASTQVSTASFETSTTNLSDATIYAFLANQSNGSQLVHENLEQIHKDDLKEIDLKWQLALLSMRAKRNRYQYSSRRTVLVEKTPPKAMVAIDGVGCDWSYMDEDEVPTNMALMDFLDSESQFESYRLKSCEIESKNASEDIPNKLKEYHDAPLVKDRVSDNKDCSVESPVVVEKKTVVPTIAKVKVVRPKQQEKLVRKIVRPKAVNTAIPKAVNTARPSPAVVNAVRGNKEFNRGYVTFGGGENGGRINGKGTIKTDNIDFEDVYFVKELKFNLFSVSQMCDRKNNILFTDTKCLVLSPNFKLPDESQIQLRVPRKNNMYNVDMKNIVP